MTTAVIEASLPHTGHPLDALLKPAAIALVGASARPDSNGLALVQMCRLDGYTGRVYPVNPRYETIEGLRCYPTLADLPERPEHVVIALPNAQIMPALEDAIRNGARAATIFASCRLEPESDPPLAEKVARCARDAGLAVCGPNSMGFYNRSIGLRVAGFPSPPDLRAGGIAFIAQSGSAFSALAHNDRRLGFSLCVSSGMELAAAAVDYIDWALEQPETRVIGLFLEQVREPERFMAALERASRINVPVVVLKVGRTAKSSAMALSHSGALAGSDLAFTAMCRKYGVILVDDLDELAATLLLFDQRHRLGPGALATMHDSGGEREMVVDLAERLGVPFAEISEETKAAIAPNLDPGLVAENPLDAWGTARDFVERYERSLAALLSDPEVATAVFFSDIREGYWYSEGLAEAVRRVARKAAKPLAIATNYSKTFNHTMALGLAREGIPVLEGTRESLLAIRHALRWRDRPRIARWAGFSNAKKAAARWRPLLAAGGVVKEVDGLALLSDFGVPVVAARQVASAEAAVAAAQAIGFPVALKTTGHAHKSDVGGVRLGLGTPEAVRAAYEDVSRRLGSEVLVAAMAEPGVEIGLGAVVDPAFGPIVVVSAGGILIEILDDKAAALAPFGPEVARELLAELKVAKLLAGARGRPPCDLEGLSTVISRFSVMVASLSGALSEVDVNPVIAGSKGAVAVDALVVTRRGKHDAA
jgi:acyl-CoA synthetase (NDP forming)